MGIVDLSFCLRSLVVGMDVQVPLINGQYATAIDFDSAATTPAFFSVIREIINFSPWYAGIYRGKGYKTILTSNLYEEGRYVIKQFVSADHARDVVIYTRNTTESINQLSYILAQEAAGQVVLSTKMEHLANDLPWRDKFNVDYVEIDKCGRLLVDDLETKLLKYNGKVKLVTVTGASNLTGYTNPIYKIARLAHAHGAMVHVDGAQLVPHELVDMRPYDSPEHIDFLSFSAHKMYAPFGIGVLIGPREAFERAEPVLKGSTNVRSVSRQSVEWTSPPARDEAGTPNVVGVVALTTAIKTINAVGRDVISDYEKYLFNYAVGGLRTIPDIEFYSCLEQDNERVSIIPLNIQGIRHDVLADILACEAGITVKNGFFGAPLYGERLLNLSTEELDYYSDNPNIAPPGMVRVSFGIFNNCQEINILIDMLNRIARNKAYYNNKYNNATLKG